MTDQKIKAKFNTLSEKQKKTIFREASIIKECGQECFWIETGCQANDPASYWLVIAYAMMDLNYLSSDKFYGLEPF